MPLEELHYCIRVINQVLSADDPHQKLYSVFLTLEAEAYNRALSDVIGSVKDYPQADLIVEKIKTLSLSILPEKISLT